MTTLTPSEICFLGAGRPSIASRFKQEPGNPPRGFHGNLSNLNAQGELPANSHLNIRVNSQSKAGWVKQASAEGMTLTQWVIKTLDAATK